MKNLVSGFIFIMTIAFALGSCEVPTDSGTTTVIPKIYENTVETPVASPEAGLVAENEKVTLSTATEGAAIYYTENNTTPTTASTLYVNGTPIIIDTNKTVKAFAVKEGWNDSGVLTAEYEVSAEVPLAPTFSPPAGTYNTNQTVTITTTTEGATIYYTTNGDVPTTGSAPQGTEDQSTVTVTVDKSMTLKAIAVKGGNKTGAVQAAYTLQPAKPTASPAEGAVTAGTKITLTTSGGAAIYYTTDGTATPTSASTLYNGTNGIVINETTTIKAVALKADWADSEVLNAPYTVSDEDNDGDNEENENQNDNDGKSPNPNDEQSVDGWIQIGSVATFAKIGHDINFPLGGKYKQTADITISNSDGWTPIGTIDSDTTNDFSGTFDGSDYNININDNLTFYTDFSFFGDTNGATLKNIHITGSGSITVENDEYAVLGGIVSNASGTTFENCSNAVKLTAYLAGGICGRIDTSSGGNYTAIIGCSNTGSIEGKINSGGIVAYGEGDYNDVIKNCFNEGSVLSAEGPVGGIVGSVTEAKIIACYNRGKVSLKIDDFASYAGGIAGYSETGEITACYNNGEVEAINGNFEDDYYIFIGGITGCTLSSVTITACYSIGTLSDKTTMQFASTPFIGGISGGSSYYDDINDLVTITACYWSAANVNVGIGGVLGQR